MARLRDGGMDVSARDARVGPAALERALADQLWGAPFGVRRARHGQRATVAAGGIGEG